MLYRIGTSIFMATLPSSEDHSTASNIEPISIILPRVVDYYLPDLRTPVFPRNAQNILFCTLGLVVGFLSLRLLFRAIDLLDGLTHWNSKLYIIGASMTARR